MITNTLTGKKIKPTLINTIKMINTIPEKDMSLTIHALVNKFEKEGCIFNKYEIDQEVLTYDLIENNKNYRLYQKYVNIGYGQYYYYISGIKQYVLQRINDEYSQYHPAGYGTQFYNKVELHDLVIYKGFRAASCD